MTCQTCFSEKKYFKMLSAEIFSIPSIQSINILAWEPSKGQLANSADPDQTSQNAASDQGLHCLH